MDMTAKQYFETFSNAEQRTLTAVAAAKALGKAASEGRKVPEEITAVMVAEIVVALGGGKSGALALLNQVSILSKMILEETKDGKESSNV